MRHPPHIQRTLLVMLPLLALWASGQALAAPAVGGPQATGVWSAQGPLQGLSGEVARLETALRRERATQTQREHEAAAEAQEIERLKDQQPGVARDLRLEQLLSQGQAHAAELSQHAALARQLDLQLRGARRALVQGADKLLQGEAGQQLAAAQRLEVLRLRAAQVEALATPDESVSQALLQTGDRPNEGADSAQDPQALRERADLLRDSADKMRREVARLELREQEILRRRALRERAAAVDEDLFGEQVLSKRGTGSQSTGAAAAPDRPAPGMAGAVPGAPSPQPSGPSSAGGNQSPAPAHASLDPALLDVLRRGETSADPEVKLEALRRARAELRRLADQLGQRARGLEQRAEALRHSK